MDTTVEGGLPTLAWPPVDRAWVEGLRKDAIDEAEKQSAEYDRNPELRDSHWHTRVYAEFVVWLRAQNSVKFWVVNRDKTVLQQFKTWLQAHYAEEYAASVAALQEKKRKDKAEAEYAYAAKYQALWIAQEQAKEAKRKEAEREFRKARKQFHVNRAAN